MSFDYNKAKYKSEGANENMWTAYSDLFLMLSTVFLLLYVSVSLRSTTSGIDVNQKVKELELVNANLKEELQVYNTLRDNHMKKEASEQEQEVYRKLMAKLDLLKDEADKEKDALRKQAKELEDKEYALNEYQRVVKSIINTNMLSKSQLQRRDLIIAKKDVITQEQKKVIEGQEEQIQDLNQEITDRRQEIAQNQAKIAKANQELQRKIAAIRQQEQEAEISKAEMNQKIANLKAITANQIKQLQAKNQEALQELNEVQANLKAAEQEAAQKGQQLAATQQELEGTKAQMEAQLAKLKSDAAANEAKLKAEFDAKVAREKMGAAEKAKALAAFQAAAKAREAELAGKLGDLSNKIAEAEGKAREAEGKAQQAETEKGRALAAVEGLKKEKEGLSQDLKRAQELANARNELAKRIKGELRKAGLSGTVDGKTGDVTLAFGEEYFDTGSAELKPSMMATLQKFMPGYSKSLFSDGKIAQNIENVEIIGFASSTYKGRYVPPDSLKPEDREAINYNLKLSFNRANAIFKHIFDTKKMSFEHQRDLLPKIKVVGRGYLPDGKSSGDFPPGMSEKEFCTKYNCKAAQKVIIKFKLKD